MTDKQMYARITLQFKSASHSRKDLGFSGCSGLLPLYKRAYSLDWPYTRCRVEACVYLYIIKSSKIGVIAL